MYDINNLFIGDKLTEFRTKNGFSRFTLSKLCDVNPRNIQRWEKNQVIPSMLEYQKLINFIEQFENKK